MCNFTPSQDVEVMLADRHITPEHIAAICDEVRENRKEIAALLCKDYCDGKLSIDVLLCPFSREIQRKHWPLVDTIREITNCSDIDCYFVPNVELDEFDRERILFERDKKPS